MVNNTKSLHYTASGPATQKVDNFGPFFFHSDTPARTARGSDVINFTIGIVHECILITADERLHITIKSMGIEYSTRDTH